MSDTKRIVTHDEAKDVALRLIAGSFRRDGERLEIGKRPEFSIPTRVDHDDDCLIMAYINQQKAEIARLNVLVEEQNIEIEGLRRILHPEIEPLGEMDMHVAAGVFGLRFSEGPNQQAELYIEDDGNYFRKTSFSISWLKTLLSVIVNGIAISQHAENLPALSSDNSLGGT